MNNANIKNLHFRVIRHICVIASQKWILYSFTRRNDVLRTVFNFRIILQRHFTGDNNIFYL